MNEQASPAPAAQKSPALLKLEKALPRIFAALSLLCFVGMAVAVYVDRQSDLTLQERGIRVDAKVLDLETQLRRRRRGVRTVNSATVEYVLQGATHTASLEVGELPEGQSTLALIVLPESLDKPVLASSVQAKGPFDYGRFFLFAIPFAALFGLILTILAFGAAAKFLAPPATVPTSEPATSNVPELRPTNHPASWSIVVGLLGLCVPLIGVIAIGLGHWGVTRAARVGIGRKAAIAGLVLGYAQTCMWGYWLVSPLF